MGDRMEFIVSEIDLLLKVCIHTILNEGTRRARHLEQWMHRGPEAKHQPRLVAVASKSHKWTKATNAHDQNQNQNPEPEPEPEHRN